MMSRMVRVPPFKDALEYRPPALLDPWDIEPEDDVELPMEFGVICRDGSVGFVSDPLPDSGSCHRRIPFERLVALSGIAVPLVRRLTVAPETRSEDVLV